MQFPVLTEDRSRELMKLIKSGSPSDPCPVRVLVSIAEPINSAVNHHLNISLQSGCMPDRWKRAKILPLLKKSGSDPEVAANYRHISLLPFFSKILEKHVHSAASAFVEEHSVLHQSQSGFRVNMSMDTALLEVSESIKETLDSGGSAVLILLDLSAAFDTVPHDQLLKRLMVLQRFTSFLVNRYQEVWSLPFSATIPRMQVGVPQGSILSLLLFNLYVAPLADLAVSLGAKIVSYTDDTQLLFTCGKGDLFNGDQINSCLSEVFAWLQNHQLKCNHEKSEIIFFGSSSGETWRDWWPANMSPPGAPVKLVKNLGVKIDCGLSMKEQVQGVVGSCFATIRMLRQFLPLLPISHSKIVVQALIMFKLDYANSLYLDLPDYLLSRLQVAQNAAARAILMIGSRSRMTPHLKALHWLPVRSRINFKTGVLAFKALHGSGAAYIGRRVQFYTPNRALHSAAHHLAIVPRFLRARAGGRSFQHCAAIFWNGLPLALRQETRLLLFRRALKTWLFQF